MGAARRVRRWLQRLGLGAVKAFPGLAGPVGRYVINRYAHAAPARPRPFSLAVDGYTSWQTLTDTGYSGRHLPVCSDAYQSRLPGEEAVVDLFMADGPRQAADTSLLFPFFAQWFTDSFLRTHPSDFRRNQSNHGIDLCQIYGMDARAARMLRAGEGGRLKSALRGGEEYGVPLFREEGGRAVLRAEFEDLYTPENFSRVFDRLDDAAKLLTVAVGLEHGNSTLGNLLMNTLFLREHNRLAALLSDAHPGWDDDRVFETARNVGIVQLLKIVLEDYIRHIADPELPLVVTPGFGERESWYRPNWIAVEFNLLYRWHGLIPAEFRLGQQSYPSTRMLAANALLFEAGVDEAVRSASAQPAGRIGLGNTQPFLRHVKQATVRLARRARLQPYNRYREHFGLEPLESFEALSDDAVLLEKLRGLYASIDDVEFLVGLFGERYAGLELMGELMLTMVAHDAFTHALTNPLLAERVFNEETFSAEGLREIEALGGLRDLVARNSGLAASDVSFRYAP